jgi:isochorismate synthase
MGLLYFKFPEEDLVKQYGTIQALDSLEDFSGFIFSDFTQQHRFGFIENQQEDHQIYLSNQEIFSINQESYLKEAHSFIEELIAQKIKKAVYSRIKSIEFDPNNVFELFNQLTEQYQNALVYLISDPTIGTWLGASPELLFNSQKGIGKTIALAGTKVIEDKSDWREKEKEEQAIVSSFIYDILKAQNMSEIKMTGPYESSAGPIKHLKSDFTFQISGSISEFIKQLHPTPAVAGFPKEKALTLINESEQHQRDLYSGILGRYDREGHKLYVNLRCCQLTAGKMHLYLGGGFTQNSKAAEEWQETENKSKTLLDLVQKL